MIPLLFDMGLPQRTADDLPRAGWDVVHVGAAGMERHTDAALVEVALCEGRTIVTLDEDVPQIVALSGSVRHRWFAFGDRALNRELATALILQVMGTIEDDIKNGCIASVSLNQIRIRRLPVN